MSEETIDDKVVRKMFSISEDENVSAEYKKLAYEVFAYGGPVSPELKDIWNEHIRKMKDKFSVTKEEKLKDLSFLVERTVRTRRNAERLEVERKTTKDPDRIEYIDAVLSDLKGVVDSNRKEIQISCIEIAPELLESAKDTNHPIEEVVNNHLWMKQTRSDYHKLSTLDEIIKDTENKVIKEVGTDFMKDEISRYRDKLDKLYERVNPELASLREEEKNKVENGMNPKQAQKERREAVKAYYNKKSQIEK